MEAERSELEISGDKKAAEAKRLAAKQVDNDRLVASLERDLEMARASLASKEEECSILQTSLSKSCAIPGDRDL